MKFNNHPIAFFIVLLLALASPAKAQVGGRVVEDETGLPLSYATIHTLDGKFGALADVNGNFNFALPYSLYPVQLRISLIDYRPDTILLQAATDQLEIHLRELDHGPTTYIDGGRIEGHANPTHLGASSIKVQVLDRAYIQQIPGANTLMDVVDYISGVRQQINCGVCGTNDIHINGMEGPYTLVLIDGMPIVSALGTVYGLNGIPSSMIERIEITKGPGSAQYGSEAMAGIINVITRDASRAAPLSLETNLNTHGEWNLDLGTAHDFGRVSSLFSGNVYQMSQRIDANGDNFTDVPLARRISLFNKWQVQRPLNRIAQFAGKVYGEDRSGGVLQWRPVNAGSDVIYGEYIRTRRAELIGSYQLPIAGEYIRLDLSGAHHDQDSWYGNSRYAAVQTTGFANLLWQKTLGSHGLLLGATARYLAYDDNTPATAIADRRIQPGIFVQDEWNPSDRMTLLGGLRLDQDRDHGPIFSPRLNLRWRPRAYTTLRLTAGSGFRNVNLFTEEHAALTGSRTVVVEEALRPERSYNVNANLVQAVNIGNSAGTLDIDLFYTYFTNRILPDYDTDPNLIIYQNLSGNSQIRGLTVKYSHTFTFPLRFELGMTAMQAFSQEDGATASQLFVPAFEAVHTLSYRWEALHTTLDWSGRLTGPMHLPSYPQLELPTRSGWFSMHNLQARTDITPVLSLSLGVRNLFNYMQRSPLIAPDRPFSDEFDTAYAYGPLQGRRIMIGMQWNVGRK
jgi:outer membrane receptor for ferrienterochelin and colicins